MKFKSEATANRIRRAALAKYLAITDRFAFWRLARRRSTVWRGIDPAARRALIFVVSYAAGAILVLSPSSRFAERYAFSATYVIATAGVFVALRQWPYLGRLLSRLDAAVPALPVLVWTLLVAGRLLAGDWLPRV